ncbi:MULTISPECIES: phage tail protein [Acinetobacter]|uniref:phage tail fiber protein n=1 Tax=Acinetobacter TaxID=469 RepID=UPI00257D06BA|nr:MULTISPECIES: phage tail protein [Acinetobacter]
MAKQTINPGTAPTGAGGDTFRSGSAKLQANDDEIYSQLGATAQGVLPAALPVNKGGTGATTAAAARAALGLGEAATRNTGTATGNVMEVGAFGLGKEVVSIPMPADSNLLGCGFYYFGESNPPSESSWLQVSKNMFVIRARYSNIPKGFEIGNKPYSNEFYLRSSSVPLDAKLWNPPVAIRHTGNTVTDANGFIKNASPIVQLFADKIELNDEARQQNIEFEKLGVGDYLVKGSSGFAQEGWYIETPKDANGNLLVAVVYEQLANGDISVKTFDYMLNNKGRIVADIEAPLDITENRWIDLRLQELPQPEIEVTDDPEQ